MAKKVHYANCKIDWNKLRIDSANEVEYISCILDYLIDYSKRHRFDHPPEKLTRAFNKMTTLIAQVEIEELPAIYEHLKKTQKEIAKSLKKTPKETRLTNLNVQHLKSAIDNIEAIMSSLDLKVVDQYQGNSYEFFKYIITNIKNLGVIDMTLEKYPHFVNLISDDGHETLIDIVVDLYLKEIKNYAQDDDLANTYDILYYDSILRKITSNKKLKEEVLNKAHNLKKIRDFKDKMNESIHRFETKSKVTYWLNQLSECLDKEKVTLNYARIKYRTDVNDNFDIGVLSEAHHLTNGGMRINYEMPVNNDVFAITIDKKGTIDLDDAVSITKNEDGSYKLGVHITDPLVYFDADNLVFDEAVNRTTTIYLGREGKVSMLPDELTQKLLTLSNTKLNCVNSYYMNINSLGEIESYYFCKEKINIARHFNYAELNDLISSGAYTKAEDEMIQNLLDLQSILSRTNKQDELYERIKASASNISDTNITGQGKSEDIINMAMLVANKTVAKYFAEHSYPFMFRNHVLDSSQSEELAYYEVLLAHEVDSKDYIRTLKNIYPSPYYDINNSGHHGLNAKAYCHATSPLRRLADLINAKCLNKLYYKVPNDKDFQEVEELVEKGSKQLKRKTKQLEIFQHEYYRIRQPKRND